MGSSDWEKFQTKEYEVLHVEDSLPDFWLVSYWAGSEFLHIFPLKKAVVSYKNDFYLRGKTQLLNFIGHDLIINSISVAS